jgi:hypothetical protein
MLCPPELVQFDRIGHRSTLQERDEQGRGLAADVHPLGLVPDAWRCIGLSNAQRDVLTQLYVSSCYHSEEEKDWMVAERMLAQRREANLDTVRTHPRTTRERLVWD